MDFLFFGAFWALSIWWLLVFGALTLLFIYATWSECGVLSSIDLAIIGGISIYLFPEILTVIITNPISIVTFIGIYFIIGLVWSGFKWYKFLVKEKRRGIKTAPIANQYKSDIAFWVAYWPIGFIKYVIGDLLEDIFKAIWSYIGGFYQKISDKVFEGIK